MTPKLLHYGLFVCGVTIGILCFGVLLVKYILGIDVVPATAYYLLALPPAWFYFRTEYHRRKEQMHELSRDAAIILLSIFLGCYLVPHLLQFLAFPKYSPTFAHYHHNALLALIASILLIRLHAYGGKAFCVFTGSMGSLTAFFFILTAIPVLSPVYYPISTAISAVLLSLFLFTMAHDEGVMKTGLIRFANITDDLWASLKTFLLAFLLIACVLLLAFSIIQPVNRGLTGMKLITLLAKTKAASADAVLPQSTYFLGIALIVLAVVCAFFYFERNLKKEHYQRLTPLLWLSMALLLVYSSCLSYVFFTSSDTPFRLHIQILVWAAVSFSAGCFLNLTPLWLWGIFLLYPFVALFMKEHTRVFVAFHPLTLACMAIILAALSVVTDRFKILYEHAYPWQWAHNAFLKPPSFLSASSQVVIYLLFLQTLNPLYRHTWPTITGMFLTVIPALIIMHTLHTSRHFLFYLPYTFACIGFMFALRAHFPEDAWLIHLKDAHLINCGLFITLITTYISEFGLPCQELAYRILKSINAKGIVILTCIVYLNFRNIDAISWQRFLTSGIVTLGAGLYFLHLIHLEEVSHKERE